MWLRLGKTKNKSSPTWRHEEKESNPSWIQKDTGQDKRGDKGKWYEKMSPQRGDKRKRKINAQVVRGYGPQIRNVTT